MIKTFFQAFCIVLLFSCNGSQERPATAMDTGRTFIRATLDGDFKTAESLLYRDTMNMGLFDSYQVYFKRLPESDRKGYKESDFTINKYDELNDSVIVINYSNSYMHRPMEIKVVRKSGEWLIDFKHSSGVEHD